MDDFTLPPPGQFAISAALFEGGLVLLALGLGYLFGFPIAQSIDWSFQGVGWGIIATCPLLLMLWWGVRHPTWPFGEILQVTDQWFVPLFQSCRLLELAIISLLAGLGEEMLFRGLLQEIIANWAGIAAGPWVGLVLASLAFGLLHWVTPGYAVLASLIGLYLGVLLIATGNLLVPITAHAMYDFLALVYFTRIRRCLVHDTPSEENPFDSSE